MEARLGAGRAVAPREPAGEGAVPPADEAGEAVPPAEAGAPNAWPDEGMESSMLSELRERGEKPAVVPVEAAEEAEPRNLPPLEELVKRLPPAARETLDDLFRVKFVAVRRIPAKALKP